MRARKAFLAMFATIVVALGGAYYAASATVNEMACQTGISAACGKCGDGYCNPRCGETATSCPRDCGGGGIPQTAK